MFVLKVCVLLYIFSLAQSARILAVFPSPSFSHQIIARTLLLKLHSKGHEIVFLTTDPLGEKAPNSNYTEIDLSFLYKYINKKDWSNANNQNRLIGLIRMYIGSWFVAEDIFAKKEVKDLISNQDNHFDLVIFEWSCHASFTAFAEHFNCPIIGLRSLGLRVEAHDAIGNPVTPSYLPVAFMSHSEDFYGRLINSLLVYSIRIMYKFCVLPNAERVARKHFPNHQKYVGDLERDVSITFTYTNQVLLGVRPLVPSVVEIGGLHLGRRNDELPKALKDYLDESEQGAIYFSLGTLVSLKEMDQEKLNILEKTFLELPYNIVIKSDHNPLEKTLKNVKYFKWLPQEAVLRHPNVRLFVSHCGLLSYFESVSNGVPIIGVPFNTDQHYNVFRIVELGIGLQIDIQTATKSDYLFAINEVMTNQSYKQNIDKISNLIRDQPISPEEKAIWWVEYVLRNKGTPYFKSKAVGMPWYIYYSLDVICFILFIIFITWKVIYSILKLISFSMLKIRKKKIL